MLWHVEIGVHFALVLYLAIRRDGRKYFEGFIVSRFLIDACQLFNERMHYFDISPTVWYAGVLFQFPLLFLSLREATTYRRGHRDILYAWTCLNLTAAWIRFFPYTGRAVLIIDLLAYSAWIVEGWWFARRIRAATSLSAPQ